MKTEEIQNPKEKLFNQLDEIEAKRERVEAELKKVREAEDATMSQLESLVHAHRRTQKRIQQGQLKQEEIETDVSDSAALNPWDNNVGAGPVIYAFSARAAKEAIRAQFNGWLKLRQDEEADARKAVCEFLASNRETVKNYVAPVHSSEFLRLLPASLSEYLTPNK